jgi:hypothetical protein
MLALASVAVLGTVAIASWFGVQAVAPKPASAPEAEFSAGRAYQHLLEMCKETHPTGSQAAMRVREYLVAAIEEMGYKAEVQRAIVPGRLHRPPYNISYIENVLVHIPGTDSSGLFLNMAHYDSVPYGLGASDDGAGCVAMLETLRALKHHPPLKNDIAFLFTDGEEAGLLGPKAFMEHPLFDDLKLVLNFEARGYYGPSMMFELSDDNGWIIEQVAQAAPSPIASSIMFDAADRMPTTTDYEVLRRAGIPGMGLAYVGGIEYYHTENDSPDKISLASLQHHGEYGLPLALHFGNVPLDGGVRAPNKVYFTLWPGYLVHYPENLLPLFGALAALGVAIAITLGFLRDELCITRLLLGTAGHLGATLLAGLMAAAVMGGAWTMQQEYLVYSTWWYYAGLAAATVAIYAGMILLLHRRAGIAGIAAGALVSWLPLLAGISVIAPGGSFLATWPLLSAAVGLGAVFLLGNRTPASIKAAIVFAASIVPVLILLPHQYLAVTGITIVPAPFWMVVLCMMLGLLALPLHWSMSVRGVWLPALGAGIALPVLASALFGLRFTETTPKMNHLCYGVNCNTGEAFWISQDRELDDFLRNFFESTDQQGTVDEFIYGWDGLALKAPAPRTNAPEPELEVLEDTVADCRRSLRLKVKSPRKAARLDIALAPGTQVYDASLQGTRLARNVPGEPQLKDDEVWRARYQGLSYDGIELTLEVDAGAPLSVAVREESFGVPPIPGINVPLRPANMVTENNVKRFWDSRFRSNVMYTLKHFSV